MNNQQADQPVKVIVAGLGNMGMSHALAYHHNPGFEIVALVNRSSIDLPEDLQHYPLLDNFDSALSDIDADLASINTYTDTHAEYAIAAMEKGLHVFVEKPLALTVADADSVIETAARCKRKLVVGYILRHHPSWQRLIHEARELGGPFVFRLNLNQQSSGPTWQTHKQLMHTTSPIVDCGVHYVDVMCQVTDAQPVKVNGMGVRLSDEVKPEMYNYGHFQVIFDDGSVGWYEAGWGPMMSDAAFFVKDIISKTGSVSIVMDEAARSDDIDTHTRTSKIKIHRADTTDSGEFALADTLLDMQDEPGHQQLCDREQQFVLDAIKTDVDLTRHMQDAVNSLAVCLAADESVRSGESVTLQKGNPA